MDTQEKYPNIQTKIRIQTLMELAGDLKDKVVLDLGASKITLTEKARAKKIITLDVSDEKKMTIKCDLNVDKIPLKDNSIDIILAGELIEHIPHTLFFLSECKRVLKNDGSLILSTPNICSLVDRIKMLFGAIPGQCARYNRQGKDDYNMHVRDFNLKEIILALELAGLKLIKAKSNGIISHSKLFFPVKLTPVTFGDTLILKVGHKK
jgi:2-polyprenyl-3-methyl-5-hydroxy-6-metoxy-1,4-benzoquinol methylase